MLHSTEFKMTNQVHIFFCLTNFDPRGLKLRQQIRVFLLGQSLDVDIEPVASSVIVQLMFSPLHHQTGV